MPDEIDLTFLGEQIRRLHADMRDLKTRSARTDADVLALNERLEALEQSVEHGFQGVGREFTVVRSDLAGIRSEMTRNLEIILAAIRQPKE